MTKRTQPLFVALAGTAACSVLADLGPPRKLESPTVESGAEAGTAVGASGDAQGDGGMTGTKAGPAPDDGAVETGVEASVVVGGSGPVQATNIALGPAQACAVIQGGPGSPDNGTVRCWGANTGGVLGSDPALIVSRSVPLPVSAYGAAPAFPSSISTVTLATGYACALTADTPSYLYCWGQFPADSRITRSTPPASYVPSIIDDNGYPLVGATTASVGTGGGCTVTAITGTNLLCWGAFAPNSGVTMLDGGIATVDSFTSVAIGRAHACGIATHFGLPDVECWGDNSQGQCGVPSPQWVSGPTRVGVSAMGNVTAVAAGGDDTCALLDTGAVYCWGANDHDQLGDQALAGTARSAVPTRVNVGASVTGVAVGSGHICALTSTTTNRSNVWCWGDNSAGQLATGAGGPTSSATPLPARRVSVTPDAGPRDVVAATEIAAGGQTTCALLLGNADVWCWGANAFGQAGQPPSPSVAYAMPVSW